MDIEANVSVLTPVAGIFAQGDTITLTSKCVMKVE